MKKLLLLALVLVLLALATSAAPAILMPRHVDPASTPEEPLFGLNIALLYYELLGKIGELNITGAASVREVLREVYIPENLRYVFSRFNELLDKVMSKMNETHTTISYAYKLIESGMYFEAEKALVNASREIPVLRALYGELVDAAREVVRAGLPRELLDRLSRVSEAIDKLDEMIRRAFELLRRVVAVGTKIVLSVEPETVYVGEEVRVWGVLEAVNGTPLAGKVVSVYFGNTVVKAQTSKEGFFNASYRVREYVRQLRVYAEYVPVGADKYVYSYSRSPEFYVNVLFFTPELQLTLDKSRVLPTEGISVVVKSMPGLVVHIKTPFGEHTVETNSTGEASLVFVVPGSAEEGVYRVVAETEPVGIYGPASAAALFTVYRLEPRVSVELPSNIVTGFKYRAKISVEPASRVTVVLPSGVLVLQGSVVEFDFTVPHFYESSKCRVEVSVEPLDPRYKKTKLIAEIPVYNTTSIVMLAAIFSVAAYYAIKTLKMRARRVSGAPVAPPAAQPAYVSAAVDPAIRAFALVVGAIARLYGVLLEKSETLREYVRKLAGKLPQQLYELIKRLVRLVEIVLYGRPEASKAASSKAEEAAREAAEMLGGGGG